MLGNTNIAVYLCRNKKYKNMGVYSSTLSGVYSTAPDPLSGLGMARPSISHQRINARICAIMNVDLNPQYEAIIEAEIGGVNSEAPDVCVWSLNEYGETVEPVIALETTTYYKRKEIESKIFKIFSKYKTIKEAFMYIYDKGEWRRYTPNSVDYVDTSLSAYLESIFKVTFDFARPLKNAVFSKLIAKRKK